MHKNAKVSVSHRSHSTRPALWSADYAQTTGQALVTRRVVERVFPALGSHMEYVYRPSGNLGAIGTWLTAFLRLWKSVAFGQVDLVYLVCSRSNAGFLRDVPALVTSRMGVRVVVHAHGSDIIDLLTARPISSLARWFYRNCELIVPSGHLVLPLQDVQTQCRYVCENFAINESPGDWTSGETRPASLRVLWNSNVMASKGVFDVMQAVRELNATGLAVTLDLLGSVIGDEEMDYVSARDRFATLFDSSSMVHHGVVSPACAANMVDDADVVALPSRYSSECQPLAIIQAMCRGCAIVASDVPALRATLMGYPAEFVRVEEVSALKDVFRQLLDERSADPASFFARRAPQAALARQRFSHCRFDKQMAKILS